VVVDETARPKHQQLTIGWSTIFHVGINHVVAYVYEYVYTYVYGMYAFLWYTYNILQQKNDCIRTSARYVKCKRILSIYWNILRESWCNHDAKLLEMNAVINLVQQSLVFHHISPYFFCSMTIQPNWPEQTMNLLSSYAHRPASIPCRQVAVPFFETSAAPSLIGRQLTKKNPLTSWSLKCQNNGTS
jgi:hypothetical protein